MLLKPEFIILRPLMNVNVMFGCDPEIELLNSDGWIRSANSVIYAFGYTDQIGYDGSGLPAELRPRPGRSPKELVANLYPLVRRLCSIASKNGLYPSVAGHQTAIGFHVHVSWPSGERIDQESMVRHIDEEVGPCIEASGDGRAYYRARLSYREQWYADSSRRGIEYRTPPGSFLFCPESARSLIAAIAKRIAVPDNHRDLELADRFEAWSRWLRETVEKAHVLPVLWGRDWKAKALRLAERLKVDSPPITRKPRNGPAKDLGVYEQIIDRFSSPRPSFEDIWSEVMRESIVRAFGMGPGKLVRSSHWMTFFGLRQSRGDWVWSLPVEKEIVLEDGSKHTIRAPEGYNPQRPPRVGLAWNVRNITDPKLAEKVAKIIVQAITEVERQ